jgi:hypothetical protein
MNKVRLGLPLSRLRIRGRENGCATRSRADIDARLRPMASARQLSLVRDVRSGWLAWPQLAKRERRLVPWPASKNIAKQLIKHNFVVSENREYHQQYQTNVSQLRFESASG